MFATWSGRTHVIFEPNASRVRRTKCWLEFLHEFDRYELLNAIGNEGDRHRLPGAPGIFLYAATARKAFFRFACITGEPGALPINRTFSSHGPPRGAPERNCHRASDRRTRLNAYALPRAARNQRRVVPSSQHAGTLFLGEHHCLPGREPSAQQTNRRGSRAAIFIPRKSNRQPPIAQRAGNVHVGAGRLISEAELTPEKLTTKFFSRRHPEEIEKLSPPARTCPPLCARDIVNLIRRGANVQQNRRGQAHDVFSNFNDHWSALAGIAMKRHRHSPLTLDIGVRLAVSCRHHTAGIRATLRSHKASNGRRRSRRGDFLRP